MDEERKYYVYMYLREDGTPYYVGKGTGDRAYSKNRTIKPPKDLSRIIFHAQNLTEEEAFAIEIEQIKKYGRVNNNTGILRNLTNGGEGFSGWIPSEEDLAKRGAASKEVSSRPEVKAKFIERMSRPEVRAKVSATAKETMNRPEVKAKKNAAIKEALNRPEMRSKMSAAAKEAMNRPEVRAKLSAAGKKRCAIERAEKLAAQANLQSFLEEPSTQLDTVAEKQQS